MILCIDPSSTCFGYAIYDGDKLREFGRIRPRKATDPANDRISHMVDEVYRMLCASERIDTVVIEDTSGKVSGRHKGNGAGLSVYGKAIGELRGMLRYQTANSVSLCMVLENEWTRGTRKAERIAAVKLYHPEYAKISDPGGDAADAIALGEWWLNYQRSQRMRLLATKAKASKGDRPF